MADEIETQGGTDESSQGAETGSVQDNGQEGGATETATIDPQEYERLKGEHGTLVQNWQKLETLANKDEVFRKELERAWKGLPAAQQAQIAKAQVQEKPNNSMSRKELEEVKQQLKQFQEVQQRQQIESLRREKFSEVQNETDRTFKKFEATPADQAEFWKRYDSMVKSEAQTYMQNGMPLPQAMNKAQYNHSFNIAGEYALLMEDRIGSLYSKRMQERNSPLKGIASPADKQGAPGVMPGVKERLLSAIKNEKSAEKRAEMYVEYGKQFGTPEGGFFKSTGGM
jgi:hypothetical protein